MADFVYNKGLGNIVELANRVNTNDPTNSVFVILVIDTATADATLKDLDTLALVLSDGGTAEVTNTNYARKAITTLTITTDDSGDEQEVDLADQTFSSISAGDSWTDAVFGYDSDSTGGTDTNVVPLTQHDVAVTPDGSDITMQFAAEGFFKAA